MDLKLICDCLAPVPIFQNLRKAGIPAERRQMCRRPLELVGEPGADPLAACGADFVVLLDDRRLIGILRKSQDDAVAGTLQPEDTKCGGLYRQLEMLRPFPLRLLVLEGRLSWKFSLSEPAVYALQYWCFRNHLFVFHTTNIEGTSKMLEVLFRRLQISIHELEPVRAPHGEP